MLAHLLCDRAFRVDVACEHRAQIEHAGCFMRDIGLLLDLGGAGDRQTTQRDDPFGDNVELIVQLGVMGLQQQVQF